MTKAAPNPRRVARERAGRAAEWIAAAYLILRGYRILKRRLRTPYGEIDLIARRGKRLAFVEVKQRPTVQDGLDALSEKQLRRIYAAAEHWIARYPALSEHEMGFDAIVVLPHWRPVYLRDACKPAGNERS